MAQTEVIELNSRVGKPIELNSRVTKKILLNSRVLNDVLLPPSGTLTLNSIVTAVPPGEILFDFTTSDLDGTVTKIELFRKESLESVFTEVAEILTPGASGQITDLAVPAGTFEYKLLITDNDALTAESNIVAGVIISSGIIDWAGIGDQTLVAGNVVPGTGGLMTFFNDGGPGDGAFIESEKLKIVNASPQNGVNGTLFVGMSTDLNTVRTGPSAGTWLVKWKWRIDSGIADVTMMPVIMGRLATTGDLNLSTLSANDMTVICDMLGTAEDLYVFRFQDTSNNLQSFASVSKGTGFQTTERNYEVEKTATQYILRIDVGGASPSTLVGNISAVNQPTSEFLHWGWLRPETTRTDPTSSVFLDEIDIS